MERGPPAVKQPTIPSRDWSDFDGTKIKYKDVDIDGLAFTLDNVFTKEECNDIIKWSEGFGYVQAALGHGNQVVSNVRKSDRCIIDSKEFANIIFERIERFLPTEFTGTSLIEINERLRFLRYDEGGFFAKHADGWYERPDRTAKSKITIQFYLNEGFIGGETTFFEKHNQKSKIPCKPKIGRILVFQHNLIHEGSKLIKGRKYTIRSDVMYSNPIR